jgi:hypothetical protein
MRHRMAHLAAAVLLGLLAASCGGAAGTHSGAAGTHSATAGTHGGAAGTHSGAAGTRGGAAAPCQPGQLALGHGPQISPATQEHGDVYTLVNRGRSACTLAGYPGVTLYDSGTSPLPFRYTDADSQYIIMAPPAAVLLRPGASAYVLVAQAACVLGDEQAAVTIRISMPRPSDATVTGRAWSDSRGVSQLYYCRGGRGGARSPVFVSPIERTQPFAATGPA